MVGKAGATSALASSRFVLNKGSAGLGVQRGSFDNLHQLNHQVAKAGFVEVRSAPQFGATSQRSLAPTGAFRRATECDVVLCVGATRDGVVRARFRTSGGTHH